jgi:hypothetical protein
VRSKALRPPTSAFSKFIAGKQFSAANRGRELGEHVMDIFSRYTTYVETARQSRDDSPTYYPLSCATLKGRDFKSVEANEQEIAPVHLRQEEHDEVYQYHSEHCNSLMCERAAAADVDEHTIYKQHTAPEVWLIKLRKREKRPECGQGGRWQRICRSQRMVLNLAHTYPEETTRCRCAAHALWSSRGRWQPKWKHSR